MTTIGYCATCQMPLIKDAWSMVRGKKYCKDCVARMNASNTQAKENDMLKRDFFDYLLSLFPNLRAAPEHWYAQIEAMLKKGYTVKNIKNTLVYCGQQGKDITEETWGQLVYIYYQEAVAWVDKLRQLRQSNEKVELVERDVTVSFRNKSAQRDMPPYKMEDL